MVTKFDKTSAVTTLKEQKLFPSAIQKNPNGTHLT